jgi:RNA polymerase sigma-70 factor (ECF subfamily)
LDRLGLAVSLQGTAVTMPSLPAIPNLLAPRQEFTIPLGSPSLKVAPNRGVCSDFLVKVAPRTSPVTPAAQPGETSVPSQGAADRQRLEELIKEHSPYVARLALRLLGREDEVDDITQEVFINLYRHLDRIRQLESVRSWLATTTVRMVRRRLRVRRIGFLLRLNQREEPTDLVAQGASGEDRAALAAVHRALATVSSGARVAWVLRYIEQEKIEDVARLCGCSASTAKRRVADAHVVVKRALGND